MDHDLQDEIEKNYIADILLSSICTSLKKVILPKVFMNEILTKKLRYECASVKKAFLIINEPLNSLEVKVEFNGEPSMDFLFNYDYDW